MKNEESKVYVYYHDLHNMRYNLYAIIQVDKMFHRNLIANDIYVSVFTPSEFKELYQRYKRFCKIDISVCRYIKIINEFYKENPEFLI